MNRLCVRVHCFPAPLGIGNILVSCGNNEFSLSASAVISAEHAAACSLVRVIVYTQLGHVQGLLLDLNHIETADWMNNYGHYHYNLAFAYIKAVSSIND